MGLSVSSAIWLTFINKVLDEIPDSIAKNNNQEWIKDTSKEMSLILTEIDTHGPDIID